MHIKKTYYTRLGIVYYIGVKKIQIFSVFESECLFYISVDI